MRAEITPAPVDMPRQPGGSNLMRKMPPAPSRTMKPGVTPSVFALTTVQGAPGAGPVPVPGPRAALAASMGKRPMRLVNHVELGTSSRLFRPAAGGAGWPPKGAARRRSSGPGSLCRRRGSVAAVLA